MSLPILDTKASAGQMETTESETTIAVTLSVADISISISSLEETTSILAGGPT